MDVILDVESAVSACEKTLLPIHSDVSCVETLALTSALVSHEEFLWYESRYDSVLRFALAVIGMADCTCFKVHEIIRMIWSPWGVQDFGQTILGPSKI